MIYDLLGVGFGPANIALAAAIEDSNINIKVIFLEKMPNIIWIEEMLFENALDIHSNIQNIPYRDLATPRNPRSRYTFINYLHENKRLHKYLNMDLLMPMRPEYAKYIQWCADKLSKYSLQNVNVNSISYSQELNQFIVNVNNSNVFYAKDIVLGHGRLPNIPKIFKNLIGDQVFHFTKYKSSISKTVKKGAKKIAIIGSSQTAAEILLHITKQYPELEVDVIMRRFAFPLKDTSPFMSEIYFPQFSKLYYHANNELKKRINSDVFRTNYSAADMDVIEEVYRQIYYDSLHNKNKITINNLCDILEIKIDNNKVQIKIFNNLHQLSVKKEFDAVILATGFKNYGSLINEIPIPELLISIKKHLILKDKAISITENYEVITDEIISGKIFLNGLSESSHGMGDAGSLSLTSLRSQIIVEQLQN